MSEGSPRSRALRPVVFDIEGARCALPLSAVDRVLPMPGVGAGRFLATATPPKSLGQRRALVRKKRRGRLEKIDEIVRRIL